MNNPIYELTESIRNVLNSNYTSKEISDYCDISYTTINELKNKKRNIEKLNFSFSQSLYRFAVNHHLDYTFLQNESKKGTHKYLSFDMPVKKILVSFERYDLFALGYLHISNDIILQNTNTLTYLNVSNSITITPQGKIYNASDLGLNFCCRYGGTGPNNFVDFLKKYSKIELSTLQETIFNNTIVEYDFETDSLETYPSKINDSFINLCSFNNKLIIAFKNCDNHTIHKYFKPLNEMISDLELLKTILSDSYAYDTTLLEIKYIKNHRTKNTEKYQTPSFNTGNDFHLILIFKDFEFWLPYNFYQYKGDIFTNPEFNDFLKDLNISYNVDKKNFFTALLDKQQSVPDISSLKIQY